MMEARGQKAPRLMNYKIPLYSASPLNPFNRISWLNATEQDTNTPPAYEDYGKKTA